MLLMLMQGTSETKASINNPPLSTYATSLSVPTDSKSTVSIAHSNTASTEPSTSKPKATKLSVENVSGRLFYVDQRFDTLQELD